MLTESEEKEVREIIEDRRRWLSFFYILRRPYVFIPTAVVFVSLVDNPDFYIGKIIIKFFHTYFSA